MMRVRMLLVFGLCVLGCTIHGIYAQSFTVNLYRAFFNGESWKVRDVVQLPQGNVWIASDGGLAEFKGQEFVYWDNDMDWGRVFDLALSADQKVWVLAEKGIYRISLAIDGQLSVPELMWEGTFSSEDQLFIDSHDLLWLIRPNHTSLLGKSPQEQGTFVEARRLFIQDGPEKKRWVVSTEGEIYLLEHTNAPLSLVHRTISAQRIQTVCAMGPNDLLLYGEYLELFHWDEEKKIGTIQRVKGPTGDIRQIQLYTPNKVLIFTSEHGYWGILSEGQFKLRSFFNMYGQNRLVAFPFNEAHNFFVNNSDQVWVATNNGLGLMHQPSFVKPPKITNSDGWCILSGGKNLTYISSAKIFRLKREQGIYDVDNISVDGFRFHTSLAYNEMGLWTGNLEGILALIASDGKLRKWDFSDRGGILFNLHASHTGDIWVCQSPQDKPLDGIIRILPKGDVRFYSKKEGLTDRLLDVQDLRDGHMYASGVGYSTYLYRYDPASDKFINLSLPLPFPETHTFEVHEFGMDSQRNIWMASTDGLLQHNGDTVIHVKVGDWPIGQEVRSILITEDDALWLSSNQLGLTYWKGDTIVHFGEDSGLPVSIMNYRTLNMDEEGYLWVGTNEGQVVSRFPFPKPQPLTTPRWLSIEIDDKLQDIESRNILKVPHLSNIKFSFVAASFPSKSVKYQGRIKELGQSWIDLDPGEGWTLRTLIPGQYTVQLRARNTIGTAWSEPLSYTFIINEVWYKRWWAVSLFMLIIIGMIIGGIFLRNLQLEHAKKRLEEIVHERTEKLEHALEAKSLFMANMSHEIRTPMHGMIATLDLFEDTPLSSEQKEYIEIIRSSNQTLLSIINDILDVSKAESGKMKLESRPFNLRNCIEQVLMTFASKAADKELALFYEIAPELPLHFLGDEVRLRQVLSNLVNNAIKFTHVGGIDIIVSPTDEDQLSNEWNVEPVCALTFQVIDSGIGISPEKQAKLFEAFSQADDTITRRYGGTGLGLTIVKYLVEQMGGSIKVESEVGKGSSFSFHIYLPQHLGLQESVDPTLLEGKHLLLLATSSRHQDWLRRHAIQWGVSIEIVNILSEAEKQFLDKKPDVVIAEANTVQELASLEDVIKPFAPMPTLVITSINNVSQLKTHKSEQQLTVIPSPLRYQVLFEWLSQAVSGGQKEQTKPDITPSSDHLIIQSLRVILAEDNLINKQLAMKMFEKIGLQQVDWVENGKKVVALAKEKHYDIIFMDVHMPEMDGLTATKIIREDHALPAQPIIIALTASAFQEDIQACMNAGMNDFMSKPFTKKSLQQVIEKWSQKIEEII